MARIKIKDGGDKDTVLDYCLPIVGTQDVGTTTVTGSIAITVSVPTILAGDIVNCQILSNSSANSFITDVAITAGTGFVVKTQNGTAGTLAYVVFHPNKA